ncbi:MAG TPA: alpha/beta hydrolase family protein [Terriglobales bacterium]|jgi:dienelactone hydrolase|nr:alpha/beta hydrolase family protein [Terriglobales bacterium]
MRRRYQKWMYDWETRLTTRDTNRVVRPFEWGLEWTRAWPGVDGKLSGGERLAESFRALNRELVADSDRFFAYPTPTDFRLERHVPAHFTARDGRAGLGHAKHKAPYLRFTSPVPSPYEENNTVSARWFPARGRRAVVLLPQWNSDAEGHNALGRLLNLAGIAALRMSMPYHDVRMPKELERADYAVSSNLGRTLAAARQAVIDVRCCLDWLQQQGYTNLGILGTSLGSCYAFIAAAHDPRLRVCGFNHASTYFADVVWTGQSTRHIRAGVEKEISLEELRDCWLAISPMAYFEKFQRFPKKSLIVYATYDLTFLPEFSRQVVEEFERRKLDHEVAVLPCGHYTTGETPFKYVDAYKLISFFRKSF